MRASCGAVEDSSQRQQGGFFAAPDQFELGSLANAHVLMAEQLDELVDPAAAHALGQQLPDLFALGRIRRFRIVQLPDGALSAGLPHPVPVRNEQGAIGAKVNRAGHHSREEEMLVSHFERCAFGPDLEGRDLLHGKLDEKKVALYDSFRAVPGLNLKPLGPTE